MAFDLFEKCSNQAAEDITSDAQESREAEKPRVPLNYITIDRRGSTTTSTTPAPGADQLPDDGMIDGPSEDGKTFTVFAHSDGTSGEGGSSRASPAAVSQTVDSSAFRTTTASSAFPE
jgi:hypothetical protein